MPPKREAIVLPFQVPAARVPTPVIPVYDPLRRATGSVPDVMFAALVVSVVADGAKPETSAAAIVPHEGAAEAAPVPVCTKKVLVVVVLPASLAIVFVAEEYSRSPSVYVVKPVPPFVVGKVPDTAPDWFSATAFHSTFVPPAFMTSDLYPAPAANLLHVSVPEPYSRSPVVTVFVPVPPLVAATVPVSEIVWPVTSIGATPVYVTAPLN